MLVNYLREGQLFPGVRYNSKTGARVRVHVS